MADRVKKKPPKAPVKTAPPVTTPASGAYERVWGPYYGYGGYYYNNTEGTGNLIGGAPVYTVTDGDDGGGDFGGGDFGGGFDGGGGDNG